MCFVVYFLLYVLLYLLSYQFLVLIKLLSKTQSGVVTILVHVCPMPPCPTLLFPGGAGVGINMFCYIFCCVFLVICFVICFVVCFVVCFALSKCRASLARTGVEKNAEK